MSTSTAVRIEGLLSSPVQLSSLLDALPFGVMLLDADRRTLMINGAAETIIGLRREEARGLPCSDVLRSNLCQRDCPVLRARDLGDSVSEAGDIINRQRQKVPLRFTASPLKDSSGRDVGFLETMEVLHPPREIDRTLGESFGFGRILGRSAKMQELFRVLPTVVQSDASVLLTGETGTGKDVVAEAIHQASSRATAPFIKVNCGALSEALLESELFGHKKGAFTGAVADKPGRFALADKGTLFLTEIGDLPVQLQVKLLTFLDDQVVYPVGGTKGLQTDVRVIAATHRHLEGMVRDGQFRADLLFRLKVVQLHLPPLRERGGDVRLLVDHFLARFCSRLGKEVKGFSEEARQKLLTYPYPGNVRELRNVIEYAVNVCGEDRIGPEHLPSYLFDAAVNGLEEERSDSVPPVVSDSPREHVSGTSWSEVERQLILDALAKVKGRRGEAAKILGWGRSTLWRKIKRYGLAG